MSFFSSLAKVVAAPLTGGASLIPGAEKAVGINDGSSPGDAYKGNFDLNQFGNDPNSSALRTMISGMSSYSPVSAQPFNYQAKDWSTGDVPGFGALRDRLNSQYNQQQQEGQDAIDRQFAAAGGGPGNGAQAKQTENLVASIAKQKGSDLEGLNAQEEQARQGLMEQENQRKFQAGMFNAGNAFDAAKFNAQMGMAHNQFLFDANSKIAGLDSAWKTSEAEARNNEFNKEMAQYQARHSGGVLGAGGFLGTGIGA